LLSLILSRQPSPLKVLHIASGDLWAGAEVQAYTLLSALQDYEGFEVAAALLNDGELAERLRNRRIAVSIMPEATLNGLEILIALRKLMQTSQPDIVHTHRIKENILGSIANRLAGNVPSVRTVHGAGEHAPTGLRRIHKTILHRLNNWCGAHLQQKIIAVSQDLAEKLTADFAREQLTVIENGVDIETVRAQRGAIVYREAMPNAIHVGIVGRLVPVKRIDIFLDMAAQLRSRHADKTWRFHVFGDGPLHRTLLAQTQQHGLTDAVTFHGHRRDIAPCIAGLDTLVMCSDHEGLPMTILEAMALQTPIVAHAVGGLSAALQGYQRGQLVSGHTAGAYAQAVVEALAKRTTPVADSHIERFSARANAHAVARLYAALSAGRT
jgi:glycosyltransferase involved in cell wall biosynthesis